MGPLLGQEFSLLGRCVACNGRDGAVDEVLVQVVERVQRLFQVAQTDEVVLERLDERQLRVRILWLYEQARVLVEKEILERFGLIALCTVQHERNCLVYFRLHKIELDEELLVALVEIVHFYWFYGRQLKNKQNSSILFKRVSFQNSFPHRDEAFEVEGAFKIVCQRHRAAHNAAQLIIAYGNCFRGGSRLQTANNDAVFE